VNQKNESTGFFSLDDFLFIDNDICDTQPPEAQPADAATRKFG
jgi:hypothetical protein